MEMGGAPPVVAKKTTHTPKAIIHQKFGDKACYKVEEVQGDTQNGCPGLAIPQKGPCLFRCSLQLPEFSVVSECFKRKKDAEQSAAEKALRKLGVDPAASNSIVREPWDELISRLSYLFADEFLSSLHPLSGHFRAALQRDGDLYGLIPVSVFAVCDTKLGNICKSINPGVESNPFLVIPLVLKAAASGSFATSEGQLWMRRQNPYPPEIIQSSISSQLSSPESIWIEAVYIPYSLEKNVESLTLNVSSTGYYLDAIARKLSLADTSKILVSRTVGKASSEMRLYFSAPEWYLVDLLSDLNVEEVTSEEGSFNARASYFSGHAIYGNAILASIGYTWRSMDLFHEDVSLQSYYRLLISKIPSGVYKLSREAILTAELPMAFTTRTNWKGSFPRDLLCSFCRQHRLSEPVFSMLSTPLKQSSEVSGSCKRLKVAESSAEETEYRNGAGVVPHGNESVGSGDTFMCEIKIYSKLQDLIIEYSPKDSYRKHSDALQNSSLRVLLCLNTYFKELDMPLEKLASAADIHIYPEKFAKTFASCPSIHNLRQRNETQRERLLDSNSINQPYIMPGHELYSFNIKGPDSGASPSNGSLACINYVAFLVAKGEHMKERVESNDEFEFEIGVGAVIPHLEAVVTQMSVGQSACFNMDLPPQELILAATGDPVKTISLLSSKVCFLEYSIVLLRVTEPLEDRMEQALFSPPLSKQRVGFALQHIKESSAATLIDFGCGSGSLLDSLLDFPTSLEKIVGVDISKKSLSRAAKLLHSKLSRNSDAGEPSGGIKSAVLYEGSITFFDPRLYGFDIGTCLEVIEHMEEDQACLFGDVVLSYFCPKVLIVSTPNYEYNAILQRSNPSNQEEDPDETSQSQACRFRNHDHKFEWTRKQFNHWASNLARKHNYSVEFSGVGGSADVEPGFASHMAVFRRSVPLETDNHPNPVDLIRQYEVVWEWDRSNR